LAHLFSELFSGCILSSKNGEGQGNSREGGFSIPFNAGII